MHQSQPSLHSLRIHLKGAPRTLTWQSLDLVQCHLKGSHSDAVHDGVLLSQGLILRNQASVLGISVVVFSL